MQAFPDEPNDNEMPLQLLLFVDKRPSSREQIKQVREALSSLMAESPFDLQVIDVGEQPYLAEHFRLVATPALIKTHPEPRQTLAGSTMIEQLQHWWSYWQRQVEDYLDTIDYSTPTPANPPKIISARVLVDAVITENQGLSATRLNGSGDTPTVEATSTFAVAAEKRNPPKGINSVAISSELIQLSDEVFRLKQENEELQHQLHFKDQIIAMLAHDLRNPLTAASIAVETLEMGHDSELGWSSRLTPTLAAQLLKHARTQIRTIDHMITDILQAARGANSELRIQPQKLDLGLLCLDILDGLQEQFQAKSQQVEKDIPSDLPTVLADGERVRQVIINLLDNAIKYTPIGGTISLSILHRTSQKVQVSIADNGPGIPEKNREQIFEDRYRLERDAKEAGYGIGLSLCQRIIRAHYGQIWVDSTENQGSYFHFTLPVFRG
jgi:two-component system clock-associated histidine kinase SasA